MEDELVDDGYDERFKDRSEEIEEDIQRKNIISLEKQYNDLLKQVNRSGR